MAGKSLTLTLFGEDKSASRAMGKVGENAGKMSGRVRGLGGSLKTAFAGLGIAAAGRAIFNFGQESIDAFTEAEQSSVKLNDAFARFPKLVDSSVGSIEKIAEAQAKKTKYDDDATKSMAAQIAMFGLTGKQLEETIPLVQDYASATGKSLPDAGKAVGMALMGNTRALKQLGINYKSTGDQTKDYANIMALLQDKVGGFAEKEGKSAAGQAEILKNQFGEVKETVGQALLPILLALGQWLIGTGIPMLQNFAGWVQQNSTVILRVGAGVLAAVAAFKAMQVVNTVATAFSSLNKIMSANPLVRVALLVGLLVAALITAWNTSKTFRTVVTSVFNAVRAVFTSVFGAIRTTVTTVVGAIRSFLTGSWNAIRSVASAAWNGIKTAIINPFTAAWNFIRSVGGKIGGFFKGVWTGIVSTAKSILGGIAGVAKSVFGGIIAVIKAPINGVIGIINGAIGLINNTIIAGANLIPFVDIPDIPKIPYLAKGGVVKATKGGRVVVVGEGGEDEAVVPLSKAGQLGFGGGDGEGAHIHLHMPVGFVGNQDQLAKVLVDTIQAAVRRGAIPAGAFGR